MLKALEEKREKKEIGNSLEADVELGLSNSGDRNFLESFKGDLPGLLLVSRVRLSEAAQGTEGVQVRVQAAAGTKCERCWNWRDTVGKDKNHPTICHRCVEAVMEK